MPAARQVLGWFDRLFLQHRTTTVLLTVYYGVVYKFLEPRPPPASSPYRTPDHAGTQAGAARLPGSSGPELLDPMAGEPLARGSGGIGRAAAPLTRRGSPAAAGTWGEPVGVASLPPEDAAAMLEQALAAVPVAAAHLGEPQVQVQLALGRLYGGAARYREAVLAMEAGIRMAAGTGSSEKAVALGHMALGQLALRHHRYSEAEGRFGEALRDGSLLTGGGGGLAALCGAGWSAVMQGASGIARAEARFLVALNRTDGTPALLAVQEDSRQLQSQRCRARRDGLDGYRVIALAGLSLSRSLGHQEAGGDATQTGEAEALDACAAKLLLGAGQGEEALMDEEPPAQLALGVAHLALGQVDAARRQLRRSRRWERLGEAAAYPCSPGDLTLCARSALYLALAEFAAGRPAVGARHLEQLPLEDELTGEEASHWLGRFAHAHVALPGGRDLSLAAFTALAARQPAEPLDG